MRLLSVLVALTVGVCPPIFSQQEEKKDPATRLAALEAEYEGKRKEAFQALYKAKTPEERMAVVNEKLPKPSDYCERFWALAEEGAGSPVSEKALIWLARNNRSEGYATSMDFQKKALTRLERDHLGAKNLAGLLEVLTRETSPVARRVVKTFSEKATEAAVRAHASMALGRQNLMVLKQIHEEDAADKDARAASLTEEAKAAFQRVANEYADIPALRKGVLGDEARRQIYRVENLMIGMVAPEVAGMDMRGKPMNLKEYRGKVVMLEFWGHW